MPLPRPTSLRFALLCLVAVAILPAYVLLGYSAFELGNRLGAKTLQDAERLTRAVAWEQERVLREAREFAQTLSRIAEIAGPARRSRCEAFLSGLHRTIPRYGNFGFAGQDGNIYCSAVPLPAAVNVSDRAYFRQATASRQFAVGDYLVGRVTGRPALTVAYPLTGADGNPAGVVFIAIDLAWLNEALRYSDLPAGSSVKVIDHAGTLLASHPDGQQPGTKLSAPAVTQAIQAIVDRKPGPAEAALWSTDNAAHAVYPITGAAKPPAFVWVELSTTAINAEITGRILHYLLWIAVATLMVFALAWVGGSALIIRAVTAVADAACRFAAGDLSARTGLKRAPAELAGLAATFDQMAEGVESREKRITEVSDELARTNRILRTLSGSNRTLLRATDETTLLGDMCRVAVETGGFRGAWVGYREDDAHKPVKPMTSAGLDDGFFTALDANWGNDEHGGVCGRAIRSGNIITTDRVTDKPASQAWWDTMHRYGIRSAIALPLRNGDEIIGIMAIYAEEEGAFVDKDFALLEELAADLSFGITTIRARAEHQRTEAALHHLALHDPGTGLPNKLQLHQSLDETLRAARDANYPVAVTLINLPRMREISGILGQHSVDRCIERIAAALRSAVGSDVLIAREARSSLAVVRPRLDISGAIRLAERLGIAVRQPFELGSCSMEIECRIGIAVFPGHATDAESLVGRASLAAQHAQASGRPYALLDTNPEETALQRLTMLGELRKAIEQDELLVYYQPKIAAATGRIVGAEALVRWNHPVRGMVSPAEFIPVAEHTGLIIPLTHEVLKIVGRQMHAWRHKHQLSIPVAVNLSAHNLRDDDLMQHIDSLIGTWGLERQLLQIEITESTLMQDPTEAMNMLTSFSQSGMHTFIDDFGTGYSSLAYLASLPVHALKIDRSFVASMMKDAQHRAIVHSILSLAGSLELKVVAEGVETQDQADMLRSLSCDELQGYLFSKPLPQDQFIDWTLRNL